MGASDLGAVIVWVAGFTSMDKSGRPTRWGRNEGGIDMGSKGRKNVKKPKTRVPEKKEQKTEQGKK